MANDTLKHWYFSKAVWGGIIAVLAGLAGLFGFDLDADTQSKLAEHAVAIASAVGGALAIYGRVKADKKVGK